MLGLYSKTKQVIFRAANAISPRGFEFFYRYRRAVKYIISGGTAAFINLFAIWLLVDIFGLFYLVGSALAFIAGFIASFILQKFFTFGDTRMHLVHRQLVIYLFIALVNLGFNTLLVYIFVDFLAIWYVFSQALASIIIAVTSFFIYRKFVFTDRA